MMYARGLARVLTITHMVCSICIPADDVGTCATMWCCDGAVTSEVVRYQVYCRVGFPLAVSLRAAPGGCWVLFLVLQKDL